MGDLKSIRAPYDSTDNSSITSMLTPLIGGRSMREWTGYIKY